MSLRKKFYCIPLFLILLALLPMLGEFTFFLYMTRLHPVPHSADLIAVFTGEAGRVEEGFRLANRGYSSHLVISNASSRALGRYKKKLETSDTFDCIVEDKSRTTFENALHTNQIMTEYGMRSVILVTSWDHMPRAYLLLFILSHASDIRIQWTRVPTGRLDAANWYCSPEGWKRVYNEMVEFWGSLYELTAYRIRGTLPDKAPNQSPEVASLRKLILFDIKRIHS